MTTLKHIINWIVWTLMGLYALLMISIRTPWVQQKLGSQVSTILSDKLNAKVSVGRIDLGFLNRLIIDDVLIYDQQQHELLKSARLTAKVDIAPLFFGRVVVSSAQVFGAHLQLSRPSSSEPTNFQFILDALASEDTTSQTPLDLRINTFIMRRSSVSYDQWDVAPTPSQFNKDHLKFDNISAYIILKSLTDDSISVNVKRMTFQEQSGVDVRRLSFQLEAGQQSARLENFKLQLPHSDLAIDSMIAYYDKDHVEETLRFQGALAQSHITPCDIAFALPVLNNFRQSLALSSHFSYKNHTLLVPQFTALSSDGSIMLEANGQLHHPKEGRDSWALHVERLKADNQILSIVSDHITPLPQPVLRLDDIQIKGNFASDLSGTLHAQADVWSNVGHLESTLQIGATKQFKCDVTTEGVNLQQLLDNNQFGQVAMNLAFNGTLSESFSAKGSIDRIDYDGDSYTNILLNGSYTDHHLTAWLQVADPKLSGELEADLHGKTIDDAVGVISLRNLNIQERDFYANYINLKSAFEDGHRVVTLNSDFAHAELTGSFNYSTLAQSLANAVGSRIPTLPGLPPTNRLITNNFELHATMANSVWMKQLLDIDLDIDQATTLSMIVNDRAQQLMVDFHAPSFSYNGKQYTNADVYITAPSDTMYLRLSIDNPQENGHALAFDIDGHAANNELSLKLNWNNSNPEKLMNGELNVNGRLYKNFNNQPEAHIRVMPSDVQIENSNWQIEPSDILYSTNRLLVDHFSVHNDEQYITINGSASDNKSDSLVVDLHNVEVAYILDLVNFDAVTFSGKASGKAFLSSAFKDPDANAHLRIDDFKFQDGRMGVLTAFVNWNKEKQQIDINATANDGPEATTYINGYVSPEHDFIDLGLSARGTYLDFMHSFTSSFISHITGNGTGDLRLAGPLSAINLTGGLVVDGEATITPLNTTYQLRRDTLTLVYNEIMLNHQPLYDKHNNVAYVTGAIHHQDLTNLSLDLHVDTEKFLGYDFESFGDMSFYGTVLASGEVDIHMKGDDVNIDCDVTPLKGSVFVYNATQADAISDQEFITWKKTDSTKNPQTVETPVSDTNIYMDFTINATPDATMRILMDSRTNDYITLNGNGAIQATYYNKGTFQMFGTYTVSSGTYDITIQNIINKKFQFQPGGTLAFSGNPYQAAINLQALYTVNGVSLSDLNIGNSFSSNTVRVNCLMNISGQPASPQVSFDLDMPTVNADEKQMVRSLLSSQQEMNQQVLFLLGIGRFYSQGQNNANEQQQQGQTSLAMQSFLSGTLSTQINNVIGQFFKNDDWNFGANIATGTEGWNNAEYEGIVNGRMLNNRLLINGQFGYRDNATQANPSFIGDFDIRYLLVPSGNYALKVYNQTNDRYFTRSSLNTQGIGIIMKRDFNGFSDFFGK